jgi:hypothetical protein
MTTRRGPGAVTTILMLIPMLAVPVMALFGVPHFMPVVASPTPASQGEPFVGFREVRTGQADGVLHPVSLRTESQSLDLFQPYGGEAVASPSPERGETDSRLDLIRRDWSDPLGSSQSSRAGQNGAVRAAGASRGNGLSPGLVTIFDSRPSQKDTPSRASSSVRYQREGSSATPRKRLPAKSQAMSWRQASQILNDLGVRTYSLTPGLNPGEFRFVCLVSSTDDPRVSRRFESNSADPLIAVEQVISQVKSWTQSEIR